MSDLLALDVAVLPPREVVHKAIALSAALPPDESQGLRLDEEHLPHVTVMQLFARANELGDVLSRVGGGVREAGPMRLSVTGGGQGASSVWLAIEKAPALVALHERLMESLRGLERPDGSTRAFFDADARLRDVLWVAGYRLKSSFHHFTPHITLGHASQAPAVEPFSFEADVVGVCHLGRFCACRKVFETFHLQSVEINR